MLKMTVLPDLSNVAAMAKEAQVQITELAFIQERADEAALAEIPKSKWLIALDIVVEGTQEALGYFTYLINQKQLTAVPP